MKKIYTFYYIQIISINNKTIHYDILVPTETILDSTNLSNQLANTQITKQFRNCHKKNIVQPDNEKIVYTEKGKNDTDKIFNIDKSMNYIINEIEPITASPNQQTNTLLFYSQKKTTNYKYTKKNHIYSVKRRKYNKNQMRKNRHSNFSYLEKQKKIDNYANNNKCNKYKIEKLKTKERLRNLRQNPDFKQKENLKNAKRIFIKRHADPEMRKKDLLRIKNLRTNRNFKLNERLRDKEYKRNKRKNPIFKKKSH